ncbi:MAG: FeoB small GTPase domain-containing protein, partial [Phycisphaerae bacterium]
MSPTSADATDPTTGVRQIAVAGNPNSGKTSIFNQLTGLRQKVGNYPGVTVEKREGRLAGTDVVLLDLPGTYSLSARSPDEEIARDLLLGRIQGIDRPDAVLLVIDSANLERNLYLACQILEFGTPVLIACNMIDVARQLGRHVDCEALSKELGVPVIPTVGNTGEGIAALRRAL